MFEKNNLIPKLPDNGKAGITIHLNQDEHEPFEVTVFLKKPGIPTEGSSDSDAISLAASGKLRLTIGQRGFLEIFAENARGFPTGESTEEEQ
jgi:hypothetical protein